MSAMPDLSAGSCRGLNPALFFPERGEPATEASAVCRTCRCSDACREWAIANETFGIWGGTGEAERQRIRKQRDANRSTDKAASQAGQRKVP